MHGVSAHHPDADAWCCKPESPYPGPVTSAPEGSGCVWTFWLTTPRISLWVMCGYAVHWIWPSTKKPSSIKCMQAARKLPLRRCRRCNGRMTKRCKTRRAILKSKSLIEGGRLPKRLHAFSIDTAFTWDESKPAVNSRNHSVRLEKDRHSIGNCSL